MKYLNGRLIRSVRRAVIKQAKKGFHITFAAALYVGALAAYGQKSSLVSVGSDGKFQYRLYANEGQNNVVNTVPDFSRAGYQCGGI